VRSPKDTGANQDAMTISSVDPVANTITFTGGTSHTYRVSAVSRNLAESAFSPSGGVTG